MAGEKLWGGRFKGQADAAFARFNSSFSFDQRLLKADIQGSLAHAEALAKAGLLTAAETSQISQGLRDILTRAEQDPKYLLSADSEDVHSFVESELVRSIGNAGYKLHTGRSRNDQVATDLRLFLRGETDSTIAALVSLQRALIDFADANSDAVVP